MSDLRIGDAQRTLALDLLSRALEEGYLNLGEFDRRASAVSQAATLFQLQAVMRDLPPRFQWDPRKPSDELLRKMQQDAKAGTYAITSLILGAVSIVLSLCVVGGALGAIAFAVSFQGARSPVHGNKALVGRILGIVGVVFSLAVLALLIFSDTSVETTN